MQRSSPGPGPGCCGLAHGGCKGPVQVSGAAGVGRGPACCGGV